MKKKHLFLAALAIVLVLCSSIGTAVAYFTTYAGANGGYVIHLGHKSEIYDLYTDVKQIKIQNVAASADDVGKFPIFVRALVYHGNDSIVTPQASANWTQDGDYFYYEVPLYADLKTDNPFNSHDPTMSMTSTLKLKVDPNPEADLEPGDLVDVIVTYQSVPAVFDAGGAAQLALSWSNQENIQNISNG